MRDREIEALNAAAKATRGVFSEMILGDLLAAAERAYSADPTRAHLVPRYVAGAYSKSGELLEGILSLWWEDKLIAAANLTRALRHEWVVLAWITDPGDLEERYTRMVRASVGRDPDQAALGSDWWRSEYDRLTLSPIEPIEFLLERFADPTTLDLTGDETQKVRALEYLYASPRGFGSAGVEKDDRGVLLVRERPMREVGTASLRASLGYALASAKALHDLSGRPWSLVEAELRPTLDYAERVAEEILRESHSSALITADPGHFPAID